MKINDFCRKHNILKSCLLSLWRSGFISLIKKSQKITLVDDNLMDTLKEGEHYVTCPTCKKKMACITLQHLKRCAAGPIIYSNLFLEHKKKTDEQKKEQSQKLKDRFQTEKGRITRNKISVASKRYNSDPDVRKMKSEIQSTRNKSQKDKISKDSKKRWADPIFRNKMKKYVSDNIEALKLSAKNARSYLNKTSKLHIGYKKTMLENGLLGFESEYAYGPYSIDEADPYAKIAIEIDGCYWHGCNTCSYKGDPKIKAIDARKSSYLKNRGWVIFHIKEHEIKKDRNVCIEMIRNLQQKRRKANADKIKESFKSGSLMVNSMKFGDSIPVLTPLSLVCRHFTPHKRMIRVETTLASVTVTEDHSLFSWETKLPCSAGALVEGDLIVGVIENELAPLKVTKLVEDEKDDYSYDLSVPGTENFVLTSGIVAHNTYSISGVSLDIEKSSKYQSMKDEYISEYDKLVEAAKRSIKIIKGLRQQKYGVGITSALGPLDRPGVQSRRNWVSPYRPVYM